MKKFFLLFLLILISCSSLIAEQQTEKEESLIKKTITEKVEIQATLPIKTVTQTSDNSKITYGFDEKDNIIRIEFPDKVFELKYLDGKLIEIKNSVNILFSYDKEKLIEINEKGEVKKFEHSKNHLTKITNSEIWDFVYDSKGLLRQAARGAGKTNLDYYPNNLIQQISRGSITSNALYDDKDRIRSINTGNSNIILGYWKDNKLIKITGQAYGKGLEVSYGPENNPNKAKIISAEDDSEFTATNTETLYKAVDIYLYCKVIRRLPVMFDGASYAIFTNYFKQGVQDYFVMNQMCEIYE